MLAQKRCGSELAFLLASLPVLLVAIGSQDSAAALLCTTTPQGTASPLGITPSLGMAA